MTTHLRARRYLLQHKIEISKLAGRVTRVGATTSMKYLQQERVVVGGWRTRLIIPLFENQGFELLQRLCLRLGEVPKMTVRVSDVAG